MMTGRFFLSFIFFSLQILSLLSFSLSPFSFLSSILSDHYNLNTTGKPPFHHLNAIATLNIMGEEQPTIPTSFSTLARDFLQQIFIRDPRKVFCFLFFCFLFLFLFFSFSFCYRFFFFCNGERGRNKEKNRILIVKTEANCCGVTATPFHFGKFDGRSTLYDLLDLKKEKRRQKERKEKMRSESRISSAGERERGNPKRKRKK